MNYTFGTLPFEDIYSFLRQTDNEFDSPLSQKVDLKEYAAKLAEFSSFAYCTDENEIIGMISCYINRPPVGYVSNVCVKSAYQGSGCFSKLFELLINETASLGMDTIRLEVNNDNKKAQEIYLHKGFRFAENSSAHSRYMEYKIEAHD